MEAIETTGQMDVSVGGSIVNGTNQKSFTLERAFLDHATPTYEYLRGMVPGTFNLTVSSGSIVNCSFGFTGRSHTVGTSRFTGATEVAAGAGTTYNASSNVAAIGEGNTQSTIVTEVSIDVDNNLRELKAVGTLGASDIGAGEFNVTGSLQTYFEDKALLTKLIDNTQTSISFAFSDGIEGNTLIFDLPAVKFSEGVPEVSGKNEDVMLNLSFQAFRHPTLGYTMKVTKFAAPL